MMRMRGATEGGGARQAEGDDATLIVTVVAGIVFMSTGILPGMLPPNKIMTT